MKIGAMRIEESEVHDTWAGQHAFHAEDGSTHGGFEIYFVNGPCCELQEDDEDYLAPGWYWQTGFPGCLPDGEPNGPFATSRQALEDADEWHPEFD